MVFEYVGLILERPDLPDVFGGYLNSPLNSATFASTGVDGTHFGVVYTEDAAATTPVVMTVAMQFDDPNHIVGASLPEFLALGFLVGFASLDSLAYEHSRDELLDALQAHRTLLDPPEALLLTAVADEFDLSPWPDVPTRLHDLATQHADSLIVDYAEDEPLEGDRVHHILTARRAAYDAAFQARQ